MANLVEVSEFENHPPAERRLPWTYRPEAATHHALSLRDFVRLLERHKKLIVVTVAAVTISVLVYQLLSPNLYSSSAQVQVQLLDEVGINQADISNRNEVRVVNAVRLYRSRSSAESVVEDLDLLSDPDFRAEVGEFPEEKAAQMHQAINTLLSALTVTSEPSSDLIEVTVTTKSPELSARIANQYPESVAKVRTRRGTEQREELLQSLLAERADREEAARNAKTELAEFRRDARMPFGLGTNENLSYMNQIAAEAASASANSAGSSSRSAVIANAAGLRSTAQATSAAVEQLQRQLATLVAERARLGATFGSNHPDVVRVTSELSSVESALAQQRAQAQAAAQAVANADAAQMREVARSQAAQDAARRESAIRSFCEMDKTIRCALIRTGGSALCCWCGRGGRRRLVGTRFIQAGAGMTTLDSNIPDQPPLIGCWWDPWWGFTCITEWSTFKTTEFSYNLGLGLRWDINNALFTRASYNREFVSVKSGSLTFDTVTLEFGLVF